MFRVSPDNKARASGISDGGDLDGEKPQDLPLGFFDQAITAPSMKAGWK